MKVFGIGWSKTGTTSLGEALEILGFTPHIGYRDDLVLAVKRGQLHKVFMETDESEAFEDWPWPLLYREMAERYPDAKFVLKTRDYEDRYHSYCKHVAREPEQTDDVIEARAFYFGRSDPEKDKDGFIAAHQRHDHNVVFYFAGKPGRLLVADWTKGDEWEELCAFLGVPEPDVPFPHANKAPEGQEL
jgi:hypothetical protein